MPKHRLICLFLSLVLLFSCASLIGCRSRGGIVEDGKGGVSFSGATVRVSVSAAQDGGVTFSAANKFTKGTDAVIGEDEVLKAVKARNNNVAAALDLDVEYETTELAYNEVFSAIQTKLLQSTAKTRIDIYHNDIYGLTRAMLAGCLWNVADPGDGVKNYFDFSHESWNIEYMRGSTFDESKIYLLAGDYHLDMLRYASVLFVNIDLFNKAYAAPNAERDFQSYRELTQKIYQTEEWYYADLIFLAREGFIDNKNMGVTDATDTRIGLCLNSLAPSLFLWGSGLSIIEERNGTPRVIETNALNPMIELSSLYTELYNGTGVLYIDQPMASTVKFMDGRLIMTVADLGEMESDKMRNTTFKRGILPFPAYNTSAELHTVIRDRAEITAVMANALSFEMASAYMQKLNEASSAIHDAYYEDSLGFRYTDVENGADVRKMIDVIWQNVDSPYESLLTGYLCQQSTSGVQVYQLMQSDAKSKALNFRANFTKYRPEYQAALEDVLTLYQTMLK